MFELVSLLMIIANFVGIILFEYASFYKISNISFKPIDLWLLVYFVLFWLFLTINSQFVYFFNFISSVFEIPLFVFWFRKRDPNKIALPTILTISVIDVSYDICFEVIHLFLDENWMLVPITSLANILVLFIIYLLISRNHSKIYSVFCGKSDKVVLFFLAYLYFSMETFYVTVETNGTRQVILVSLFIILILQGVFTACLLYFNQKINSKILKVEKQKSLAEYAKNMESYAQYLEAGQDELRRFKHDINNLLHSVNVDNDANKKMLNEYVNHYVTSKSIKRYKDVNHIKIAPLKNILLTKMATMISKKIEYNFECIRTIDMLPANISVFDLVRVWGIALDNAIEVSQTSDGKIDILLFLNKQGGIEFEVRNKISKQKVDLKKIQQSGFTTKKNHHGLGLANVKEIVEKYPNLFLDLFIEDNCFVFSLVIDKEY